jgi:ribonuclease P protein component
MIKFKDLFKFEQKEIKIAFQSATIKDQISGFKLLQAPTEAAFGKILIVTPRKMGNACKRNKIRRQVKNIFFQEKLYKNPISSILLTYPEATKLNFDQIKAFLVKNLS